MSQAPKLLDIIFISSPDAKFCVEGSLLIPDLARNICELLFHDVSQPISHLAPAKQEDIQRGLDFAVGKDKLIVACQMGVSRSSAMAYLIKAREVGVKAALSILNPNVHMPNGVVIKHGAKILGEPDMVDVVNTWKYEADILQSNSGPSLYIHPEDDYDY